MFIYVYAIFLNLLQKVYILKYIRCLGAELEVYIIIMLLNFFQIYSALNNKGVEGTGMLNKQGNCKKLCSTVIHYI